MPCRPWISYPPPSTTCAHRDELTGRDVWLFSVGPGAALGGWTETIAESLRLPTAPSISTHP
ncbi:hypothetical protein AB0M45_30860 [Nocardia sp. NPDC051787]|uniref:hypothetical protein n=1 Tax=Nocardia sp. NPDC051787 TaxID=3155415 RepID=UPI003431DE4C